MPSSPPTTTSQTNLDIEANSEPERPSLNLRAPTIRRWVLIVGGIALLIFLPTCTLLRPPAIPPTLIGTVPSLSLELTDNHDIHVWNSKTSTDRFVVVSMAINYWYNQRGNLEINFDLHASDPFSSQAGGGLSPEEQILVTNWAAKELAESPATSTEFAQALLAPDRTYRTVVQSVRLWWWVCVLLGVVMIPTIPMWFRYLRYRPQLRNRSRLARGLCPGCKYDLSGGTIPYAECSECGSVWNPDELLAPVKL